MISETIDLLGKKARDKVTGFDGVISSVSFDLFGCVMAVVQPVAKDGEYKDGKYFDVQRLLITDEDRSMPVPEFTAVATRPADYTHGPADKPAYPR